MQEKKMNISVNPESNSQNNNAIKIGTHNGLFHCDEVVACALLAVFSETVPPNSKDLEIIRTRSPEILGQCDLCVDIGNGGYDHHYNGFNESRKQINESILQQTKTTPLYKTNSKFASAGLIYKQFGRGLLQEFVNDSSPIESSPLTEEQINGLFSQIDESIIDPVDLQDNGEQNSEHLFDYIPLFNPSWHESQDLQNFDKKFEETLRLSIDILKSYLRTMTHNLDELSQSHSQNSESSSNQVDHDSIIRLTVQQYLNTIQSNITNALGNIMDDTTKTVCVEELFSTEVQGQLFTEVQNQLNQYLESHSSFPYPQEQRQAIIKQKIYRIIDDFYGDRIIVKIIDHAQLSEHSILTIPSQTLNWAPSIIEHNSKNPKNAIDFVMYPYPAGGWAIQCVPPSIDKIFMQRIPFKPYKELPDGITKIHPGLFFATGESPEVLQKLCEEAINYKSHIELTI